MIRLLNHIGGMILIFVLLISAVRGIGALGKPSDAVTMLAKYQCAPEPCWHGIYPGQDSIREAQNKLFTGSDLVVIPDVVQPCWKINANLLWHGCITRNDNLGLDGPVIAIGLYPPKDSLRLGDVIGVFGEPTNYIMCPVANLPGLNVNGIYLLTLIQFKDGLSVSAYSGPHPAKPLVDPSMIVYVASYMPTSFNYQHELKWRGFANLQGYTGNCAD